jgi:hypothetical protein
LSVRWTIPEYAVGVEFDNSNAGLISELSISMFSYTNVYTQVGTGLVGTVGNLKIIILI